MNHYENIPKELIDLRQWVVAVNGSKVPWQINGEPASSTTPATWASFDEVHEMVEYKIAEYLGFVFNDNGIVGIDIDMGFEDNGIISELARDIISRCKSYTEKSRSGRGFHIIVKGDIPFKGRNNLKGVEIYKASRYFIMTGDVFIYRTIRENQDALDYIIRNYFTEEREASFSARHDKIYHPRWNIEEGKMPLRPRYPKIEEGGRNISLTSLAGQLHKKGYTKDKILEELFRCNEEACVPPLGVWEIEQIVNSVTRYRRKNEE